MSDLQTSMGDDMILQMIVCLRVRDGKEAVEQLKAMYDLGELALQHQASAQHPSQHPKPKPDVVVSSSDPASSGDDSH
jgi:hypothetical protein